MVRRKSETKEKIVPTESALSGKTSSSVKRRNPVAVLSGWLALVLGSAPAMAAADGSSAATGAIEGRVLNATNGEYVENARITVEGTTLEAFTQSDGTYRSPRVQAGRVQLRTFYTGLNPRSEAVNVPAGQTVQHDVSLDPVSAPDRYRRFDCETRPNGGFHFQADGRCRHRDQRAAFRCQHHQRRFGR